jgi:VWFA-related protein
MRRIAIVGVIAVLVGAAAPRAQQRPAPDTPDVFMSRTTAILVDVVVRDKKGQPVLDLEAADFEILEDGVKQKVGSFALINRGQGIGIGVKFKQPDHTTLVDTRAPKPAAGADPEQLPASTAIIFDALSADALAKSQRAALDYLPPDGESGARIAIFATVPSMQILQPYTQDIAAIRNGIRAVTAAGTMAADMKKDRMASLFEQRTTLESQADRLSQLASAGGGALAETGAAIGQLEMESRLVQGQMRLIQAFDAIDRDHRGFGAMTTLLTAIDSLSVRPGRKTVVLFSEGLPASPALQNQMQRIIEVANHANVTVYAVDAAGLRVTSTIEDTRKEIDQVGADRLRQASLGRDTAEGPYTRMLERTEDLLRMDPQGGLAHLSEDTGGFLIRDTNDIGSAFRRIDEDSRIHYLLTYSPSNETFDGKFRSIDVKIARPGVQIFARKGYRAVRTSGAVRPPAYEAPAVAMLESGKLPNAFPVRAGGLVFPNREGSAVVPVIVKVNTSSLEFDVDRARGTYSGQVAVVARVRNVYGDVVQKLSQQYVLSGDEKDVEAARRGEILFYREPKLAPGVYELESIVYDIVSNKASARVSTITVPEFGRGGLQMSSVMIIAKTEKVDAVSPATEAPLYFGNILLYPNLGDPVNKGTEGELAFYFSLYPDRGRPVTTATLSLLKNGRQVAEAKLEVGESPRSAERVQHVGKLPLASLPAGTYELQVAVSDGRTSQARSAYFTIGS